MTSALPDTSTNVVAATTSNSACVYGTFEDSLIDICDVSEVVAATYTVTTRPHCSDDNHSHEKRDSDSDDDNDESRYCRSCAQDDCCFVVAFVYAPIRLQTYRVLAFHVANAAFAVVAAVWTLALLLVKLLCAWTSASNERMRRLESASLRLLLQIDAALLHFVAPPRKHIQVYKPSSSTLESERKNEGKHLVVSSVYVQIYFSLAKLVCSAVPGVIATAAFVWSLQHLLAITLCGVVVASSSTSNASTSASCDVGMFGMLDDDGSSSSTSVGAHLIATAAVAQYFDVRVLLSVLAVYGATMWMRVVAYTARHVTLFFCTEQRLVVVVAAVA